MRLEAISVWGEFEARLRIWAREDGELWTGLDSLGLDQAWGLWSVVCSFTLPNILATCAPWSHTSESPVTVR